jgi:restriction system protein
MSMPTKWDLTLPVLEITSDDNNHPVKEMITILADKFKLNQDQCEQRLKSGEKRFNNRVRWAAWVLASQAFNKDWDCNVSNHRFG